MNDLEIQMLGLSRSGNHAIANWIWLQAKGPKVLLNCCEGKTNPYLSCRPMEAHLKGWREDGPGLYSGGRDGQHADVGLLMHTYEDSWLRYAFSNALQDQHDTWLGLTRRKISLIVLRDPFNLFASRLRAGETMAPHVLRRMWKQHARTAFGANGTLPGEVCVVCYNDWTRDPSYRARLAARLGLTFTDAGANRVPPTNGGSSFDGTAFDGDARRMATRDRWRHYVGDPSYRALFDPEMVEMSAKLFGSPPDWARTSANPT
ncbi:hypothetical protein [Pseudosulfitobacter koreensis]|uniref:Sulfotransferase family protein n=1 Tax=Pseudosulfitobacter koreensis TaxID=2968472 RepID=A0ABT1YX15_9RHOB|nr:hypothetical protein [Pseudosulfitobacter koreense]MCR8825412.1 hypothetical protein [Pseudosulfitobacter koreense]